MFCSECGTENIEDSKFCKKCGKPMGQAEEAAPPAEEIPAQAAATEQPPEPQETAAVPPPPPMGAAAPMPPQGGAVPPQPAAAAIAETGPPRKKWVLPVILSVVGLLVAAAIALVLVFVVFKSNPAEGPEKVATQMFQAIEAGDWEAVTKLIEPSYLRELNRETEGNADLLLEDYIMGSLPGDDPRFTDLKYKTTVTGDKATVVVVSGTLTYTDWDGKKQSQTVSEKSGDLPAFEMIKKAGTWYVDLESMT